jgi:hypothetical protein
MPRSFKTTLLASTLLVSLLPASTLSSWALSQSEIKDQLIVKWDETVAEMPSAHRRMALENCLISISNNGLYNDPELSARVQAEKEAVAQAEANKVAADKQQSAAIYEARDRENRKDDAQRQVQYDQEQQEFMQREAQRKIDDATRLKAIANKQKEEMAAEARTRIEEEAAAQAKQEAIRNHIFSAPATTVLLSLTKPYQGIVTITALADVTLTAASINRGNCDSTYYDPAYPNSLKFGEMANVGLGCSVLEILIDTDQGSMTFTFPPG